MKNAELFFVVGLVSDDSMWAYTFSKFRQSNLKWKVQFCPNIVTLKMFMHDVWVNWHPLLPHGCCYEGGAFGRDSSFMYFEEVDKISKDAYKINTEESDE